MFWYAIALVGTSMFAGAGIKWMVDRIWPPNRPILEATTATLLLVQDLLKDTQGRHAYTADNTMDVLADGFEAGRHSEQTREPWISYIGGGEPGVAQPGGGWLNGSMMDPLPPAGDELPSGGV